MEPTCLAATHWCRQGAHECGQDACASYDERIFRLVDGQATFAGANAASPTDDASNDVTGPVF